MSEMVEIDKEELAALEVAYNALGGHQRIEFREIIRDLEAWSELNQGAFSRSAAWWIDKLVKLADQGDRSHRARGEVARKTR